MKNVPPPLALPLVVADLGLETLPGSAIRPTVGVGVGLGLGLGKFSPTKFDQRQSEGGCHYTTLLEVSNTPYRSKKKAKKKCGRVQLESHKIGRVTWLESHKISRAELESHRCIWG